MANRDDGAAQEFQTDLDRLIQERLTTLAEAASVHASLQVLLEHEAERIERRLGTQHPRSQQLKTRVRYNLQLARILEVERQLTQIEVPEVVEGTALVHGRIVDEDDLGIGGLTAGLVDQSGTPVRNLPEPVSEASGYFSVQLDPEVVDGLIEQFADGIFLALFTPRRRLIFRQPKPLKLARGARVLVEIKLNRGDLRAGTSVPPATVVVPKLTGITLKTAKKKIKAAKLTLGDISGPSPTDQSIVQRQEPSAGSNVPAGTLVHVVVRIAE